MSISDSSMSLRAHVDSALPPVYERLFAVLDLLLALRAGPQSDIDRITELRETLDDRLAQFDPGDRRESGEQTRAAGASRRPR